VIGRLEGRLHQVRPGEVVLDVGGVGYRVLTSLRAFSELERVKTTALWIHTHVRDDAIVLFGFPARTELEAFEKLITVAGVGPRMALAVLSGLGADDLAAAIESDDVVRLQRVPGIGRKTAERLILELRGRFGDHLSAAGGRRADVISALTNLGYSARDAERAADHALSESTADDLGEVLRVALKRLTRR